MRKLSRQYQLPDLERTIADIEVNRRRYEGEALEIYNKVDLTFRYNFASYFQRLSPGKYELEVTLPFDVSSLKEVLSNLHPQRFSALKSSIIESLGLSLKDQEFAQSLSDTIYTYKSTKFDSWKMMPLFESTAYIINGDRFVTFDGRVFAFHARCEYLLASDLRTQRFALLAIFSSQGHLEAIKVELRGEEVILYKTGNVICTSKWCAGINAMAEDRWH
ncbi:unnamed protein product [Onchocerca flexuosa]|uniref:VWFD domain-containing protein n=1 Tax=Onchocerca flexuosa TaxID=387005 RepID=A0A183HG52_9BILA|nr:unnamed protein product [Onchocerca flexuosa]